MKFGIFFLLLTAALSLTGCTYYVYDGDCREHMRGRTQPPPPPAPDHPSYQTDHPKSYAAPTAAPTQDDPRAVALTPGAPQTVAQNAPIDVERLPRVSESKEFIRNIPDNSFAPLWDKIAIVEGGKTQIVWAVLAINNKGQLLNGDDAKPFYINLPWEIVPMVTYVTGADGQPKVDDKNVKVTVVRKVWVGAIRR